MCDGVEEGEEKHRAGSKEGKKHCLKKIGVQEAIELGHKKNGSSIYRAKGNR